MTRRCILCLACVAFVNGSAFGAMYRLTDLGDLPGGQDSSVAYGLSPTASLVTGVSQSSSGTRAFLWQNGTMTNLGVLAGHNYSEGNAVNDSGQVVGSSLIEDSGGQLAGNRPFLYSGGVM